MWKCCNHRAFSLPWWSGPGRVFLEKIAYLVLPPHENSSGRSVWTQKKRVKTNIYIYVSVYLHANNVALCLCKVPWLLLLRDSQVMVEAVCGSEHPDAAEESATTVVSVLDLDADLPWPRPLGSLPATHDPRSTWRTKKRPFPTT